MSSSWHLISWNVNGLRAAEKKGFLPWLAQTGATVVAVQETKAQPAQLSAALREPPGYHTAWHSAEKKGYSGVGTYSQVRPHHIQTGFNDARFDSEGRVLLSDFGPFVLFNIYFPNGGRGPEWVTHKLAFYERFLAVAQGYVRAGRGVVVTGDFNTAYAEIDLARPKENAHTSGFLPEERAMLDAVWAAGFIDTFRALHPTTVAYTWWDQVSRARDRNVGWRLDYFIISENLRPALRAAAIHTEVLGSDHCPVSLTLEFPA